MTMVKASRVLISSYMALFSPPLKQPIVFPKYQNFYFFSRKSLYILICNFLMIFDALLRNPFPSTHKPNGTPIFFFCIILLNPWIFSPFLPLVMFLARKTEKQFYVNITEVPVPETVNSWGQNRTIVHLLQIGLAPNSLSTSQRLPHCTARTTRQGCWLCFTWISRAS